ncbi:endolytic transglycosylase MltG [Actinomadura kijaniata]|uniref:endolytic transglycosylase MltG n=1 Tax=Actinomadura kijaniata TaxID=46161 RepID=UPI000832CBEC|nr:endolytic transglycosylase MltG [Actinomadura kijaniata]
MNDLDLFSEPDRNRQWADDGQRSDERPPPRRAQRQARRQQRRKKRNSRAALLFSLAFLVAVVGTGGVFGVAWLDHRMNPPDYEGEGAGSVTIQIKEGDGGSTIAATLQRHDVVKSVRGFLKVYAEEKRAGTIQPGYYAMRLRMSSKAAMTRLLDPKSRAGNQIIISEGKRAVEIFQELSRKTGIPVNDFVKASRDPRALGAPSWAKPPSSALNRIEGYLYPGRYDVNPKDGAAKILKQMVARFNQMAREIDLEGEAKKADLKPETVITLASLIQAEGGQDSDLPKISRVIRNRLRINMHLRFDTTIVYFLNRRTLNVRERDYTTPHPYNTYQHQGLTPGPISNPGVKAIQAALKPEPGNWLYFVATDPTNKVTKFTDSEAEFNKFVEEFRAWQRNNPGN